MRGPKPRIEECFDTATLACTQMMAELEQNNHLEQGFLEMSFQTFRLLFDLINSLKKDVNSILRDYEFRYKQVEGGEK